MKKKRGTDVSEFQLQYRRQIPGSLPDNILIELTKSTDLKYGQNPSQRAAIYTPDQIAGRNASTIAELTGLEYVRTDGAGKGGFSLTNYNYMARAMGCLKFFTKPAVVTTKHNILSGFAGQTDPGQSLADLYRLARDADRRSNSGCGVAFNRPIDIEAAKALLELKGTGYFVDVLGAIDFEDGVLGYLHANTENMRFFKYSNLESLPKFHGDDTHGLIDIVSLPDGSFAGEDPFLTRIKSAKDLIFDPMIKGCYVETDPPTHRIDDMITGWHLNIAGLRSNGVNIIKDCVSTSLGSGLVERIRALEMAIVVGLQIAMRKHGMDVDPLNGALGWEELDDNPLEGAVCTSDGFIPFPDSVELANRVGIIAILQPFGSTRDEEVIKTANECGMAMAATGERCFGHF